MIQAQVINYLLTSKDASVITLNGLTSDYFSDFTGEYNFIRSHLNTYGNIPDVSTFLNVFPDFEVMNVSESTNYLLSELMRDKNKRFLADNYNKARQLIMDGKVEEAMTILKTASEQSTDFISLNAVDLIHDTSRFDSYETGNNSFDLNE